jgi:RNA polymerase sigma-70 factor (ECF subfamily)
MEQMTNTAELSTTALAGDPEAFRLLVDGYRHRLFRLAYRMTGQTQDAEDLVQETFLRAYRNLARFDARASMGTWLYRICTNAALDHLRQRRPRERAQVPIEDDYVSTTATPERLAASGETQIAITRALDALSPVERAAFTLRHYEQMSIAEIGAALGLGTNATKNTIFRGVQKLRRELAPLQKGCL